MDAGSKWTILTKDEERKAPTFLTENEENSILRFIQFLRPIGWNWKLRTFTTFLVHFAKDCEIRNTPLTATWREKFLEKHHQSIPARFHPFFQLKPKANADPVTPEEFFTVVEEMYRQLDVSEKPESIWNFDATSVMLPEPQKKNSRKRKQYEEDPEPPKEEHTSVMYAVSAAGEHTPATILFKGVRIAAEWKGLLQETDKERVQLMVNGYGIFDYPSTHKWLKSILMRSALPRPLILFMDSHYSHVDNYEFIKQAYDDSIHLISLPPKMPALKLPLGLTVMGLLKNKWYEDLDELQLAATASNPLTRAQIVNALMPADTEALQEENIKNGFARCGLFPFDATATPGIEPVKPGPVVEVEPPTYDLPPLSPGMQQAVDEAMEVFSRAGVPEKKAKRLLRNMNVPGLNPTSSVSVLIV